MSSSSADTNPKRQRASEPWRQMRSRLRARGLLPVPDQVYRQVEGRFVDTLPSVSPPPHFRESLASNLDLWAQHRQSGVIIKQEPVRRTGTLVALGILSLAAAGGLVTLVILLARGGARHPTLA